MKQTYLDFAVESLKDQTRKWFNETPIRDLALLIEKIDYVMGVNIRDSYGTQRGFQQTRAMIVYCYMAKECKQFTLKEIGQAAGVQHATVIHHLKRENRDKKFTELLFYTHVDWVQKQLLRKPL